MQELEKILEEIKDELKDIYLDIANNYNISDLQYDGDKVACVASKFRCDAGRRIEKIIRKHMNDGWIPVECKLPKTNGIYNVARHIDGRFISDSSYFDGQNTWHSDNRVNHSRPYLTDVIAWRPLPEPYCPEQPETCKYTGGSCCWPIDQCGECPNNQGK